MNLLTVLLSLLPVLSGPDARLQVSFEDTAGQLRYTVAYDGKTLVAPSLLGLQTNEVDYTRLECVSVDTQEGRDTYVLDRIKASHIDHAALCAVLHCQNPDGRKIEWHLTANDAAFRYVIPREGETGSVRVLAEASAFRFPEGTTGFLTPQSDAMIGWKRSKPSYEEHYTLDAPLDRRSQYGHGYTFPCLFRVGGDGWVLVSETGVDSRYCASHLSDYDAAEGYTIAFPMPEENNGNGTVEPAFSLPGATPWRTITVGADLAPIVETTIAFDVVTPRYETTRSYRYGKSSWSWIVWQDASMNQADQVAYIDLAAAMEWPYILIDAGWDQEFGHAGMEELVRYARSKGVDVFLWYSSSGWWNDIVQSPVNVMCDPLARKPEMRWMESIGVKGVKVDFFGGDKQETMRLYEAILSDADDHGLMCIFHGATLPRGWERMYPNYVGSEAVLASENMVFGQNHCDIRCRRDQQQTDCRQQPSHARLPGQFSSAENYIDDKQRDHQDTECQQPLINAVFEFIPEKVAEELPVRAQETSRKTCDDFTDCHTVCPFVVHRLDMTELQRQIPDDLIDDKGNQERNRKPADIAKNAFIVLILLQPSNDTQQGQHTGAADI